MMPTIKVCGDSGITVLFGNSIDPSINRKAHQLKKEIEKRRIHGIIEMIPSYCALLICYDPMTISYKQLCKVVSFVLGTMDSIEKKLREVIHIPVLYGGDIGQDIEHVSKYNDLSIAELIAMHSERKYLVYMIGFKPGFLYLGGLNERLSTPRLESPRLHVAAGSIGIAGNQTGIYPQDSPGGWQLIGHTCIPLIDWSLSELTPIKAGQYIKFEPVDKEHYEWIQKALEAGNYQLRISVEEE